MIVVIAAAILAQVCLADVPTLSIYQIQYTTDPAGNSSYDGQMVNCTGGIVIYKYSKGRQRIILYDGVHSDGWGGITVKALNGYPFNSVNLGDWVSLSNVWVYETAYKSSGNTTLFYDSSFSSSFTVDSNNNPLPQPTVVSITDIPAPVYDPARSGWYVANHNAEKYESMYIKVKDVNVGSMNLGKSNPPDNYSLCSPADPSISCWASDYMNKDKDPALYYMSIIAPGLHLCSVSGILEQYTNLGGSTRWDYYQLLTTSSGDLKTQTGDLNRDCKVDFADFAYFAQQWLNDYCNDPDWCNGTDFSKDGIVDEADLAILVDNWLSITD